MKTIALGILAALFAGAALFFAWRAYDPNTSLWGNPEPEQGVCTLEAKLCPDGSYVGRIPPTCEFAACPQAQSGASVTLETKIDQGASGLDLKIVPLAVLEDSRCPVDVQCIQAGTVRVRALLTSGMGEATQDFTLGQPITTEAETVTLVAVRPEAHSEVPIDAFGYTFVFKVEKR